MVEISIKIVDCLHAWKTPPAIAVSAEKVYALKTNQATFERKYKFVYFSLLSFGMIAYAFLTTKPAQLFQGLYRIYFNPCHLFSDFVAIGGFGATLVNIALIILVELLVIWRSKGTQTGTIITSIFTTVGYAFFGTSLFNFLPILLGSTSMPDSKKYPLIPCFFRLLWVLPSGRSSITSLLGSDSTPHWESGWVSWLDL